MEPISRNKPTLLQRLTGVANEEVNDDSLIKSLFRPGYAIHKWIQREARINELSKFPFYEDEERDTRDQGIDLMGSIAFLLLHAGTGAGLAYGAYELASYLSSQY